MPKVNISQAAKLAGLSRTQFYDGYVKKGIVSVDRSIPRRPKIDTAEIIRVFGTLHADNEKPDNVVHHLTDKKSTSYNVDLSENVKELTARIGQLETEKADAPCAIRTLAELRVDWEFGGRGNEPWKLTTPFTGAPP